jgi:hypothetical protein
MTDSKNFFGDNNVHPLFPPEEQGELDLTKKLGKKEKKKEPLKPNEVKLTKKKFTAMIGGWKKFRDFLHNHKQLYIPPPNDFTAEFGLEIL